MSITVIITQVTKVHGEQFWFKGTVGGNAFTAIWRQKFLDVSNSAMPASIAEWFGNLYQIIADINTAYFANRTLTSRMDDGNSIDCVFGATPFAFVGYDFVEITATVNSVASTKCLISYDDLLTYANSSGPGKQTVQDRVCRLLYTSQLNKANTLAAFVATFSSVTTTSSETTTTSTTTTTTSTTSTTTSTTTSDKRLKFNLMPIGTVAGLTVYTYDMVGKSGRQIGLLAQDVYERFPNAVVVGGDDPLTNPWKINYGVLLPLMAAEVASPLRSMLELACV